MQKKKKRYMMTINEYDLKFASPKKPFMYVGNLQIDHQFVKPMVCMI